MIAFILIVNSAIAVVNFWLAWKLLRSLPLLRQLTRSLQTTDQGMQDILSPAPYVIALGQVNIRQFRQTTQTWAKQGQQLQILMATLLWMLRSRRY